MSKRILVTGVNGQLGQSLKALVNASPDFIFAGRAEMDLSLLSALEEKLEFYHPDIIVNCAAYTAVDKAEEEEELALTVNALAPEIMAKYCRKHQSGLIHLSTDYVFDGTQSRPYLETDPVSPLNAYGRTKLHGERKVLNAYPDAVIIRTSWVHSPYGNNFVKTMLRLMDTRDSIKVVSDQKGTPTYAHDLAGAILHIIQSNQWIPGIYHFSNAGETTWFDFALEIKKLAGKQTEVHPITTEEYPVKALRPKYSVLNKSKIRNHFGIPIPGWQEGLKNCLKELGIFTNRESAD